MAIIKQAKNIKIIVNKHYNVKAGTLNEISNSINIESFKENLSLNSNKKVQQKGNDGGVKHQSYSPPELQIEESEYKLESTFAMDQLFSFAEKDSMAMFCFWMTEIFGGDIPLNSYEKLYKEASDKKETINPKITVAKEVPGFGAAYYTGSNEKYKNHIIISQGFIELAIQNNEYQKLLMIALVEEFGHHLDYLLRYEYSSVQGDAKGDEGAKFSSKMNKKYKSYLIDPFKNKDQHYATATIEGEEKKLVWDFADLHEKLKEFVENRTEYDDNYFAGFEFFGAGMGDNLHGLGHQAIEEKALRKIERYADRGKEKNQERSQIYFGNWLRDFSQFVDPMVVRPMANAMDMLSEEYKAKNQNEEENKKLLEDLEKLKEENRVTKNDIRTYNMPIDFQFSMTEANIIWEPTAFSPVKMSREAITSLVEFLGLKEFGEIKHVQGEGDKKRPQNYMKYIQDFRKKYAKITTELLGVYKPQEHIDNPAALHPRLICEEIQKKNKKKGTNKPCPPPDFNNKLDPDFVKDPVESQWEPNSRYGTKNYIRGNGPIPFESAFDCFNQFIEKSNPNTIEGRINFGAALHIVEDYYAHSNFCEIAVMKVYDPEVFPWDNLPDTCVKGTLKTHKADSTSNSHAYTSAVARKSSAQKFGNFELDKSRFKFITHTNPHLFPESVKNHLKTTNAKSVADYYNKLNPNVPYNSQNKGLYYSHAACAIVQTGSFGILDTIASIAPKVNNKIFSIKAEEQEDMEPGERTFNDALIYELLKDISKAQASDTKEKNSKYKGKDDNAYSDAFLKYLEFRDFMLTEPMKSFAKVMNAFGFFDYITQYIKVIKNSFYHFLALAAINMIDDYQTYLENELFLIETGNWKVNPYGPTHTQLAKDNGLQPLHRLAVELAENRVHKLGELFIMGNAGIKEIKKIAETEIFVHPMYTDWMDQQVLHWCQKYPDNLKIANQASIVLWGIKHGYQELAELHHQINIISQFNTTEEQQKEFRSALAGLPDQWHKGWNRLSALWDKQGLEKIKLKTAEESYQEALNEAGYDK